MPGNPVTEQTMGRQEMTEFDLLGMLTRMGFVQVKVDAESGIHQVVLLHLTAACQRHLSIGRLWAQKGLQEKNRIVNLVLSCGLSLELNPNLSRVLVSELSLGLSPALSWQLSK